MTEVMSLLRVDTRYQSKHPLKQPEQYPKRSNGFFWCFSFQKIKWHKVALSDFI